MLDYPLEDVITLMVHHMDKKRRTEQISTAGKYARNPREEVIYRKAGDDWF